MFVLHKCDNPSCVRPDHLYLGTHRDNMKDMVVRGRSAKGNKSPTRLHPESIAYGDRNGRHTHPEKTARGERHGKAKLNWAQVDEIRALCKNSLLTIRQMAANYGVSHGVIVKIIGGKTWREEWRDEK